MALFGSDARTVLKRLADKTYGSGQERHQLLAQLAAIDGLRARDVVWMLFRPDRAYRDAVVGLLKRMAEPETADVVVAECKGKPEAAVRAAAATLFSLGIPGTEQRLTDLAASPKADVQETVRRLILDAPVSPTLEPVLWQMAGSGRVEDRLVFLARLATSPADARSVARWHRIARDPEKAVREKALGFLAPHDPQSSIDLLVEQLPVASYSTQSPSSRTSSRDRRRRPAEPRAGLAPRRVAGENGLARERGRGFMKKSIHVLNVTLLLSGVGVVPGARPSAAQSVPAPTPRYPDLPGETPDRVEPSTHGFDYARREEMIPMRDGVRLHTVILVPKGAKAAPILLTRTPYDADKLTTHSESAHLGPTLSGYDNPTDVIVEGGYIRVVQDIRGKHRSEGDYVMNRPMRGPQNPTPVDHATDTYDTIDWLVRHVPETNGRVGILGISYDGFLALTALFDPHPALKVAVPMNPMVDGWIGDDWFHSGAFRQQNMPYIWEQEATRKSEAMWWTGHFDDYDTYMQAGSAGELGRRHGLEQVGFWRKILAHPSYDAFWREQAMDKLLAARPLTVPVMLVHSLWDQEDIYGALAVYEAIEPKDTDNDKVFLVMGPWNHGQEIEDGSALGALRFGRDTALEFRREILRPFLDRYLKDGARPGDVPPVAAFETGTDTWRHLDAWPAGCASGCQVRSTPLYLRAGLRLGFEAPGPDEAPFEEYVSDPAKPVPYQSRPIQPVGYENERAWPNWLVSDQREASGRPDVVAFVSEVLTAPVKIAGRPIARLVASTSGTDSDWVVKLIDVYPDEVAGQPKLGGYQLMISADIFRGRYRASLETPEPLTPDVPLPYRFALPTANHVFRPGHRIMVQVQSSWFPLYDRNPQTFVPSIFRAQPTDFRKAVQRIHHAPGQASFIELPLVDRTAEGAAP